MQEHEAIRLVEDGLGKLTKRDLIHLVESTNCARDFVRNIRAMHASGDCDCLDCMAIARKLGFKAGD